MDLDAWPGFSFTSKNPSTASRTMWLSSLKLCHPASICHHSQDRPYGPRKNRNRDHGIRYLSRDRRQRRTKGQNGTDQSWETKAQLEPLQSRLVLAIVREACRIQAGKLEDFQNAGMDISRYQPSKPHSIRSGYTANHSATPYGNASISRHHVLSARHLTLDGA